MDHPGLSPFAHVARCTSGRIDESSRETFQNQSRIGGNQTTICSHAKKCQSIPGRIVVLAIKASRGIGSSFTGSPISSVVPAVCTHRCLGNTNHFFRLRLSFFKFARIDSCDLVQQKPWNGLLPSHQNPDLSQKTFHAPRNSDRIRIIEGSNTSERSFYHSSIGSSQKTNS